MIYGSADFIAVANDRSIPHVITKYGPVIFSKELLKKFGIQSGELINQDVFEGLVREHLHSTEVKLAIEELMQEVEH